MSNIIDSIQLSGTTYQIQGSGGGVPESAFTAYTAATDARIAEDEEVTAAGLNELNEAVSDISGNYVTKASNVVSGYTLYTLIPDITIGLVDSSIFTEEFLYKKNVSNLPTNDSISFYLKNSNGNSTYRQATLNWQAHTASTTADTTITWSNELNGFVFTITDESYPYFYGLTSSSSYSSDGRVYYKTGVVDDKQSAAYLNSIEKGTKADYVVGFPNSTSISSDGSLMIELLKEKSSIRHSYKICNTDDFDWGSKGISYKLVEGDYFYSTATLGSGNYCQLPFNAADNYQNGYLGVKLLINPNYDTQNTNRQITINLGGVTNKTDTFWGSYQSLSIYYNGSTDTVNFNNIVGTYGVSSATYDQTSHYITIIIDSESTYSSKYWVIRQISQGNCWIGVNYQITEVQWYTNKYKPFDYLDKYKQDTLVSGTNIKTINNESILGSGNIEIQGGGGTVDQTIISGSTNAVAGGAVYNKFDEVEQVTAAALNNINDRLSEDEEVTAAGLNAVNEKFGGLKLQQITQSAYDALVTKDASTLYIIVN